MNYEKNLLNALRLVTFKENDSPLTNENLVKAVTVNEELNNIGYTLNATDVVRLAKSTSVDSIYDKIRDMVPEIDASPMYPDFPTQVMGMDEATYRFHQCVHYFSTYGMEELFGVNVDKGWMPDVPSNEKTEKDTRLLDSKVIELVSEKEMYEKPMNIILSKRERMTNMEKEIIKDAVPNVSDKFLATLKIPFKENMESLFLHIAENQEKDVALKNLKAVCQHTGDVLRFTEKYLNNHKFHLKTSEKKMFVKLIESYSTSDLESNLVPSKKMEKRHNVILQHLDYNKYSRSIEHKNIVNLCRDNKLHSWEATARRMIAEHNPKALDFVSKRPGMALRMVSLLIREGYNVEDVKNALCKNSTALSTQTLLSTYFKLKKDEINGLTPTLRKSHLSEKMATKEREKESIRIERKGKALNDTSLVFKNVLESKFKAIDTPIKCKKVFIKDDGFDLADMPANPSDKSMNSGYLPSTVAYKIPDNAKFIRVYVYWNDKNRVDVDLHATAITKDNKYCHIGWNGDYCNNGIVMSGDITHSNAAEYIDIALDSNVKYAGVNLDLFSGQPDFKHVDTCFAGIMAVDKIGKEVGLYSPENSFFTFDVNTESRAYSLGYIDVNNRTLRFIGEPSDRSDIYMPPTYIGENPYSMKEYLNMVIKCQDATIVSTPDEADVVITMTKPENEKELSLVDNNFFYDCKTTEEKVIINEKQEEYIQNALLNLDEKLDVENEEFIQSVEVDKAEQCYDER